VLTFLRQAKHAHKTEFLVGFETEFILLKSTDPVEPVNIHDWTSSAGLLAGSTETVVLQEIADAIRASGIALETVHAEAAPGQYEVSTGPLSPLEAADALVHTREIIVQVAAKHGLHATFAPRPFMTSAGTSAHAHISVHPQTEQKTAAGLSKHESAFLAGVLAHLPAIAAFSLPTTASYTRMVDGVWSGGTYVCYGTENREAPIRITNVASPASRNFEARFLDGTANPHLALAAVFAGGLIGLQNMMALEMGDCISKSAAALTASERQALGITTRMPLSLDEARKNLEQDSVLSNVLGKDLVQSYLSVNKVDEYVSSLRNPPH
jgi:glutamine synthetase